MKKKTNKEEKKSEVSRYEAQYPSSADSLLCGLEATRHEPKINVAEKLVDVIIKSRQREKKDPPLKLYVVTMLIFFFFRLKEPFEVKWFNYVIYYHKRL